MCSGAKWIIPRKGINEWISPAFPVPTLMMSLCLGISCWAILFGSSCFFIIEDRNRKFLGDNQPDRDRSHCPHVNLLMKEYCCKKSSAFLLANPPHHFFSSPILHPWKTQGGSRSYLVCPHWPPHPWRGWPSVRVHLPCFPYICYSDSFRQRLHYPTGRNLFLNHRDYNSIKDWWEQNAYCVAFSVLI